MSLKFLAKKGWHTTNIKNVEKVWIAEEKATKESKKMAELQKQIQEERQIQELRALQVASGQAIKHTDTTMDWMYEGPSAQSAQSTEEFLLGKIYKPQVGGRDADALPTKEPGSLWMNKVSTKNDSFTRLHEDPMLAIKRLEKSARENVLNNPVKMARIKMRIAREIEDAEEKKHKKLEKKHKKEKHRSREHSRSRSGSRDRHRRREDRSPRRSRSRSRERDRGDEDSHHGKKRRRSASPSREDRHPPHSSSSNRGEIREGYGLVKRGDRTVDSSSRSGGVGPNPELVSKRLAEDEEKKNWRQNMKKNSASTLTEEEKAKRLDAMQRDASVNDTIRQSRITALAQRVASGSAADESSTNPDFINSMRTEIYNGANSQDMEERLKRNRYYSQRTADFDKGFMQM